jgi:hypothetical protein
MVRLLRGSLASEVLRKSKAFWLSPDLRAAGPGQGFWRRRRRSAGMGAARRARPVQARAWAAAAQPTAAAARPGHRPAAQPPRRPLLTHLRYSRPMVVSTSELSGLCSSASEYVSAAAW